MFPIMKQEERQKERERREEREISDLKFSVAIKC